MRGTMSTKDPDDTPAIRWFKKRAKARTGDEGLMTKQHLVAREAGFSSWATLRAATEDERQTAIDRLKAADVYPA